MPLGINFNRFLQLTTDFKDLALRVPRHQLSRLKRIKKKYERNLVRQNALPTELPRINWDYYRENLGPASYKFLAEFEEKYKNFEIPLPPQHEVTAKYDEAKVELSVVVQQYNDESNCRIKYYNEALQQYKMMMPYSEMTMEDYFNLFPKDAPDFINRPSFWPHTPEEQIGYVKPVPKICIRKDKRDRKVSYKGALGKHNPPKLEKH